VAESSQFASALLLSAQTGGWQVDIEGDNADELPYVAMTTKLVAGFPRQGGTFQIEPDTSSGSYFVAAGELFRRGGVAPVTVRDWPVSDWQIDSQFPRVLPLPARVSRIARPGTDIPELGDSIMTGIVLAPFAAQACEFLDLGRLRVQECERVKALHTELVKCGAQLTETGDTLTVRPSALHGAEIETYNDHRMAMCFATLGLVVPGMRIKNPACVKKTFPNFFQKLAAPAPHGLGAEIWAVEDGRRTRRLAGPELFAA
jgi:3-phosphoshikimate 1-carboxyvinyltransferase